MPPDNCGIEDWGAKRFWLEPTPGALTPGTRVLTEEAFANCEASHGIWGNDADCGCAKEPKGSGATAPEAVGVSVPIG